MLAIQIFDQKKFKKKDQGFLGVINVRIGSVIDLEIGGDGWFPAARDWFIPAANHTIQKCLHGT